MPRLIQKKNKSDDEDAPSSSTFVYSQKPANEMYASSKMCESHSSSDDDNDEEFVAKKIAVNRSWFPREDYSEDDDLVSARMTDSDVDFIYFQE